MVTLGEISDVKSGIILSKTRDIKDSVKVPYLRVANVRRDHLHLAEGLGLTNVTEIPTGLLPLTEPRRIVAKVEQLMALMDRLEVRLAASRESGGKLLEAVVGEVINH